MVSSPAAAAWVDAYADRMTACLTPLAHMLVGVITADHVLYGVLGQSFSRAAVTPCMTLYTALSTVLVWHVAVVHGLCLCLQNTCHREGAVA